MVMISIVICLALEVFASHLSRFRSYNWVSSYTRFMHSLFRGHHAWDSPWGVLAVLLIPVLVAALFQEGLSETWLGLFELIFSIVVLVYCLRYQPQDEQVDDLCDAIENNDPEQARQHAEKILGHEPEADTDLVKQVAQNLFINANEKLFAVILWFALLGPMGAILYRLVWVYQQHPAEQQTEGFNQSMHRLMTILDWLPTRLLVLGYAITGSFEDTIHAWRQVYDLELDDSATLNHMILLYAGSGSINLARYEQKDGDNVQQGQFDITAVKAARGLVLRTMLAWGIVIAAITLTGWAT